MFGITEGNQFTVYGQFHDKESAEEFMEKLCEFFGIGGNKDG